MKDDQDFGCFGKGVDGYMLYMDFMHDRKMPQTRGGDPSLFKMKLGFWLVVGGALFIAALFNMPK